MKLMAYAKSPENAPKLVQYAMYEQEKELVDYRPKWQPQKRAQYGIGTCTWGTTS